MCENETIAAIATGLTDSGIGIIRISGENAVEVGNRLFRSPSGKEILKNALSHTLYYGYIVENSFLTDEVMAVVMKAPKSFTGEDTVEIHCHGGVFVMQKILKAVLNSGARLAEPGEFTKRAFLNGRIDLSRAEAVMDVIHSQNEYALFSSVNQLKGSLEKEIRDLRSEIIYEIAFIESALDDPEHISLEGYQDRLAEKLKFLSERIGALISTSEDGRLIKEGINTVIAGKPNVGKSSLMNFFTGEERAIVTEIAGTTRDVLRETVKMEGIHFNITDTAGIRDTEDVVERIGVEKAEKYVKDADLILYVADSSVPLDESDRRIIPLMKDKKVIVLLNKSDLPGVVTESDVLGLFRELLPERLTGNTGNIDIPVVKISVKNGDGTETFRQKVKDMFFRGEINLNHEVMITNIRHKEALQEAYDALQMVRKSVQQKMPEDFYSIDLMSAYASLGRIIGEEVDDDLVEEIFSKFCMGK
ncbi:MAG: tRNA uridine-5-carboxymethylaminomethyl(34) synthesis GTPase MnmE [Butyrivibrio sp.]|nr:tRNA uridine-5-carboxymethylaminomethyl(34) synthesis GTPase MnmE [Acetatifactor muris]MCM1559780.1 tRNA uridine-5-carboxymethylaminomethyl(34) synthesis GTPase MnmE [Butyrivibrio sp.]